jgi:hypothetical protein
MLAIGYVRSGVPSRLLQSGGYRIKLHGAWHDVPPNSVFIDPAIPREKNSVNYWFDVHGRVQVQWFAPVTASELPAAAASPSRQKRSWVSSVFDKAA